MRKLLFLSSSLEALLFLTLSLALLLKLVKVEQFCNCYPLETKHLVSLK